MKQILKHVWFFRYDIVIFLLIESVALFFFYQEYLNSKRQVLTEKKNAVEIAYNSVMEMYAQIALVVYDEVINQPEILTFVEKMGQTEDLEQREALNAQLAHAIYPAYLRLRERPDFSRQFMRGFRAINASAPYLPGENVDSLRITLADGTLLTEIPMQQKAEQESTSTAFSASAHEHSVKYAIDVGTARPGMRYLFPLFAGQQKIGMAEIGFSFYGIREKIEGLLQCEILLLFRKDAFRSRQIQTTDYADSMMNPEYVQDRLNVFVREGRDTIERINEQIAEDAVQLMRRASTEFVMHAAIENRNFLITFFPIRNHEHASLGYMVAYSQNDLLAGYVENFAIKSVISMLIVLLSVIVYRRTQEIREAKKLFGALHHVGQMVTSELRVEAIFHAVTKGAAALLNTDSSVIHLLDDSGETLRMSGAYGLNSLLAPAMNDRIEESLVGQVIRTNTPLILNDLPRLHDIRQCEHERFSEDCPGLKFSTIDGNAVSLLNLYQTRQQEFHVHSSRQRFRDYDFYRYAMDNEGVVALVSVPLQVGTRVIGTLDVLSKQNKQAFRSKHLKMLTVLAGQAAIAIENAQLYETLREESVRDQLTGLYNRRYMEEALRQAVYNAKRRKCPISILLFDIDHFKHVNDTYGHHVGDSVLREIGTLLRVNVRGEDIACRYGGEEFLVILPGASLAHATQRAEALRATVQELRIGCGETISVTISIGVAVFPDHGSEMNDVISNADKALYLAKHSGRNQVKCFKMNREQCGASVAYQ